MVLAQILVEYPLPRIPPTRERSRNLPYLTLYMCHLLQNPNSDQNEISTYNVNALENRVVMRIESMIREDQSDILTNSPNCFY